MIPSGHLRGGLYIWFRGEIWQVVEAMHVKPGKGAAFVRTRLRQVRSQEMLNVVYRASEKLAEAKVEKIEAVYSYRDGGAYVFFGGSGECMIEVAQEVLGERVELLKEGQEDIVVLACEGQVVCVELPAFVELRVVETTPDERGDTAGGGGKKLARLETGVWVKVPFFVGTAEVVRIDTRTREFVGRGGGG